MAKRRLTRRQRERIRHIQEARLARAGKRAARREQALTSGSLGPEQTGQIIANFGKMVVLEDEAGALHRCVPRQNLETLVAGDRVIWQSTLPGEGVVVALEPRRSLLARPEPGGGRKPVAANIDQIVVVIAPRPEPSDTLIDRYVVAAEAFGVRPLVLLNKIDLLDPAGREPFRQRLHVYESIGYRVLFASSRESHGLDALIEELQGKTSVLVGQSGVGKSSLVKALLPDLEIRIGALSAATGRGRHTTTVTTLYHLATGGELIDSPGVWDFALWHLEPGDVAAGFAEFRPFLGKCRFADCSHRVEPGCALKEAAGTGAIQPSRLASYYEIMDSLQER
jgi:ribosome biogenesis GTPase